MIAKVVVDFSTFQDQNSKSCIVKELSLIDVDSLCIQHYIFKSPKDVWDTPTYDSAIVRHNNWLSTHFHGLNYYEGDVKYSDLSRTLDYICDKVQFIFAPTTEKAAALEEMLSGRRVVISLELMGYQPLSVNTLNVNSENQCLIHRIYAPGFYCTQGSVLKLAKWCKDNATRLNMDDAAARKNTFGVWHLSSPSAVDLAEHGFVKYAGTKDSTKCVYCGVDLFQWKEEDDPFKDHKLHSPFCKLIARMEERKELNSDASRDVATQCDCFGCGFRGEDTVEGVACIDGFSCRA